MLWIFSFVTAALAAALLTGMVRRHAAAKSILDLPSDRGLHAVATPRGGGLSIAIVTLAVLAVARGAGLLDGRTFAALAGGSLLIAAIGWWDDRHGVSARLRGIVHFVAAVWALAWLGGLPRLVFGETVAEPNLLGSLLAIVGIVWSTNLYNFMDGIDGIAAVEGISVGALGGALLLAGGQPGLAAVALGVGGACAGFLYWNRTPAKIFMGDVGSALLGYLFATLAIASENAGAVPIMIWAILAGVFIFDATTTLLRRALRGHGWPKPHRTHAYQRAVQAGLSHMQVTGIVLATNVGLGALALWSWQDPGRVMAAGAVALSLLVALYVLAERLTSRAATHPRPGAVESGYVAPPRS